MKHLKKGGNPLVDRQESIERFSEVIEPILLKKGFVRLKNNSHIMVSSSTKTIIIPKSAPSDVKHVRELKDLVKDLSKKLEGYSIYILFHRDTQEWYDKPIYRSTLRRIMDNKKLRGVVCGIDNFVKSLNNICNNKLTFQI